MSANWGRAAATPSCRQGRVCSGFRTTAHRGRAARRRGRRPKAFREGTRGSGSRRCVARYGDFGTVPGGVSAVDTAGGAIVRRCSAGEATWDARQRELEADLSFAGLPGRARLRLVVDQRERSEVQRRMKLPGLMTY